MNRNRIMSAAIMFAVYLVAFCIWKAVNGTLTTQKFAIGVMVALATAIIGELSVGLFTRMFENAKQNGHSKG